MTLDWFRRHQKHFLAGLAVFLMIAWGAGGALDSLVGTQYAGRVFGEKVPAAVIRDMAFRWEKSQVGSRYAHRIGESELWDSYILLQEARQMGLDAGPQEVRAAVLGDFRFFDKTGFNMTAYQNFLNQAGLDVAMHEKTLEEQILVGKLLSILRNSAKVSTEDAWQEYAESNEKVKVKYVAIETDALVPAMTTTDEEIKAFYETHKGNFPDRAAGKPGYKRDESARIEYVVVRKGDLLAPAEVTEDEIKAHYEKNKESYKIEEEKEPADKKEDEKGKPEKKGKADEKKDANKDDKKEPTYRPLSEVKDEIRKQLAEEKAESRMAAIVDKMDRKIEARMDKETECSLAAVAEEMGEPSIGYVRTAFITASEAGILPGRVDFQKDVADAEELTPSAIADCPEGKFIFQVLAIEPAAVQPLEEVKRRVEADLKKDKALKRVMEVAEEARAQAKTLDECLKRFKEKFGAAAKDLTIEESSLFTRPHSLGRGGPEKHQLDTGIPGDHPIFADEAFRLSEGRIGLAVEEGAETTCYLMALAGRQAADRDEFEKEKSRLIQRYTFAKMSDLQDAWMTDLRKRADLEIFKH
ncbi:MAG: SurA N-terminal domain-containing protein [Planctomycetota bacterium]